MRAETFKRVDGLWDWRIRAGNGQVIATSGTQGYTERNDASEGLARLMEGIQGYQVEVIDDEEER